VLFRSKGGPALGRGTRPLVGGDHEPQHQQSRGYRGGADYGRKGFKQIHQDGKYAIFPFNLPSQTGCATASRGAAATAPGAQQPLQIFFSRAFISASSALILSTYLPASTFESGAARDAGLAAADVAGGGAARS